MSVSTDGILFYGYLIKEGEEPWVESDHDEYIEDKLHEKGIVIKPDCEYNEDTKHIYHKYWDAKREHLEKLGCKVILHCSSIYIMYGIGVTESTKEANRGYPQEINSLEIKPEWEYCLKQYCELLNIEFSESPRWYLCSYWG